MKPLSHLTLSSVMQIFEYQTDRLDSLRHGFGMTLNPDLTVTVRYKEHEVLLAPTQWRCAEPLKMAPPARRELSRVDAQGEPLPAPVNIAAKRRGRPPKERT